MTDSDSRAEETSRRYRNPPFEHRFRKGASGNPRGRPRKIRALVATKIGGQPGIGFEDRIKSLAIEEAYRIITIREGDRTERIPVIQAIVRKVAVAAANGNIRAQQNILSLVTGAEAERRMATMELFTTAVEYKEHWGRVLAERARSGATGPEPVPHPDGHHHRPQDRRSPVRWPSFGATVDGGGAVACHVAGAATDAEASR
jgi:hypothetical protein